MSYKFCSQCVDKTACADKKACYLFALGTIKDDESDFSVDASLQNAKSKDNNPVKSNEKEMDKPDTCLNCGYDVKHKSDYSKHQDETGHGLFSLINGGKSEYDRTK